MDNKIIINDLHNLSINEFGLKYNIPLFIKKKILMADAVEYPWAEDNWLTQNKVGWIYDEVPAIEDKKDWEKLDDSSRQLLTKLFLFFTQIEVEVNQIYLKYINIFQPFEIKKMLIKYAEVETMHAAAYKYLMINIFGEKTNNMMHEFLEYQTMLEKYEALQNYQLDSVVNLVTTIIMFGAFSEGVLLYASFAIFLFFPYVRKVLKATGDLLSWSTRDESLHVHSMSLLFKELINQLPPITLSIIEENVYKKAEEMVNLEWNFIDWIFENININDINCSNDPKNQLNPKILKEYIGYKANIRLKQFGFKPIYPIEANPLEWMDFFGTVEFSNFFETTVTEYNRVKSDDISSDDINDLFI
jgi:ribonucleoside-diphosphate reductase beta chain